MFGWIYAFTETWLTTHTLSSQLFDDSYEVFRLDRSNLTSNKTSGGGVLIAVREIFKPLELKPPNTPGVELVWVALPLTGKTVYIYVVYVPPDRTNDPALVEQYLQSLSWIVSKMKIYDSTLVLGDFNLSCLHWISNTTASLFVDVSSSTISPLSARFFDDHYLVNLAQINDIANENNIRLDLCFVNSDVLGQYSVTRAPAPLVKDVRHHPPLHLNILQIV